jgi:hypothetical protein
MVTSWTNQGAGGASYNATEATNGPLKTTLSGKTVLQFNSSTNKKLKLTTEFTVSTGSVFMVGYQTSNRMVGFGGSLDTVGNGNSFLGTVAVMEL